MEGATSGAGNQPKSSEARNSSTSSNDKTIKGADKFKIVVSEEGSMADLRPSNGARMMERLGDDGQAVGGILNQGQKGYFKCCGL